MEKFNAFIPFSSLEICKSDDGMDEMIVSGIASTNSIDSDEEILEPSGFDIEDFLDKGKINWNHKQEADAFIGEPVEAKVVKGELGKDALYTKIKLYKGIKRAEDAYNLASILKSNNSSRKIGISIEGKAIERDPKNHKRVTKAKITGAALTLSPKNKDTYIDIVKSEDFYSYDIVNSESGPNIILEEVDLIKGEGVRVDSDMNIEFFTKSQEKVEKSLTDKDILYHVFSKFNTQGGIYGDILKSKDLLDKYAGIVTKVETISKSNKQMDNKEILSKADSMLDQLIKGDFSSFSNSSTEEEVAKKKQEELEKAKKEEELKKAEEAAKASGNEELVKSFQASIQESSELKKALTDIATLVKATKEENAELRKSIEDLNKRPQGFKGVVTKDFLEKGHVSEDGKVVTLNPVYPAHKKQIKDLLIEERDSMYKGESRYDNEIQKAISVGETSAWTVVNPVAEKILFAKGIRVSEEIFG